MQLGFEILDGALSGQKFLIKEGTRLGRTRGDILLPDPKASGLHAFIETDHGGQLILTDDNSSNGVYLGDEKVSKVALFPEVVFRIGNTHIRVVDFTESPEVNQLDLALPWRAIIEQMDLPDSRITNNINRLIGAFQPMVRLTFAAGMQTDQSLLLGYGPRRAGAISMDICLEDPDVPDEVFVLTPGPGVAVLRSLSDSLLVNENFIREGKECLLADGDVIKIGSAMLKVKYE